MIDQYRAKRKKYGLLLLAALAAAMILEICGLIVPGCIVAGAAAFGLGVPFIHYNELARRAPKSAAEPGPADGKPVFIAPLSAGLTKTMLYFDPHRHMCLIRYPDSGHAKEIPTIEAGEMLCEKGNYFGALKLGKAANINFTSTINACAGRDRVRRMEALRPPADGEVRERTMLLGMVVEVGRSGVWVPDVEQSSVADGMEDQLAAYCIQQAKLADEPKPPLAGRTRYDRSMNRYRWSVPLEDSRTYFLTMVFGGDHEFLHYSLDVETANDSHYTFTLGGENEIRPLLAGPDADLSQYTKLLHELMADFLTHSRGSTLEAMVKKICTEQFHF